MEIFNTIQWVLLGIFVAIVVLCVVLTIVKFIKGKKNQPKKANPVEVKDGVRFTPNDNIETAEGDVAISYVKEDIILQPRKMVTVGNKKNQIKPGKYTVLSAYENEQKFNIRIGNFVKEYSHGQEIVLAEGEEICPTSSTIILR